MIHKGFSTTPQYRKTQTQTEPQQWGSFCWENINILVFAILINENKLYPTDTDKKAYIDAVCKVATDMMAEHITDMKKWNGIAE